MKKDNVIYYLNKEFLCPKLINFNSTVVSHAYKQFSYGRKTWIYNAEIEIRDCTNSIDLEFYINSDEQFESSIQKIEILEKHLQEMKTALTKM